MERMFHKTRVALAWYKPAIVMDQQVWATYFDRTYMFLAYCPNHRIRFKVNSTLSYRSLTLFETTLLWI